MQDVSSVGGKAASLGEMGRVGFCVPGGFAVVADCFEMILDVGSLREKIYALMGDIQYVDIQSVEKASKKIQKLVQEIKIPVDIAQEIEKAYTALGVSYVAVRSSATVEDGQEHAWAGQLRSHLYVSRVNVLTRLIDCWASFYSPRALCYRFEKGLTQTHVGIAVVIQKMVESEISGVAFSIHPVSQNRNQIIIEAGFGLGEAIVSGSITPDSYVIEKKSKKIISSKIEIQTKALYRSKNGIRWRMIYKTRATSQKLTHKQITVLAQQVIDIEHYYGYPCDIEWAYEKDVFFIVQCRPITTLHKIDNTQTILTKLKIQLEYNTLGQWVAPTLECQTWLNWAKTADAKVYNLNTHALDTIVITGHYLLLKQGPYCQLQKIFENEFQTGNFTKSQKTIDLAKKLSDQCMDMAKKIGPNIRHIDFMKAYRLLCRLRFPWMACSPLGDAGELILKQYSAINHAPAIDTILTNDQKYLFACKQLLKKNRQQAEKQIRAYQKKTEYIGTYHFWGKGRDMDSLLKAIKKSKQVFLCSESNIDFDVAKSESTFLALISQAIRWRVDCAQSSACLAYTLRPFLTKLATTHGITYDDIIFLTTTEIGNLYQGKELKNMSEIIRARQQGFGLLKMNAQNNGLLVPTGEHLYKLEKHFGLLKKYQSKTEITGTIGNKGLVQGTVALVFKPSDQTKVKPSMIMVSPETTPNFLPAMVRAAAFVTDQGGITSHAAIIAREMNKPCIIATQNATKFLRDGDRVEVDAYTGVVRILKSL